MGIAISDEHLELSGVAAAFLERTGARAEARALLDAPEESLPGAWKEMADLGWLGLHLPEAHGGSGFGLAELAIVVEALGAAIAPGPFLPTVWASAVIAAAAPEALQAALLPGLADGSVRGAVGLDETSGLVLGAGLAELFLLPRGDDLVVAGRDDVTVTMPANTDATRRVGTVTLTATPPADRVLTGARATAVVLGRLLAAAEATGGAQTCVTMASEYAKVREQFGRVIGMFQAVKHQAADMLVATAARHRRHVGRRAHRTGHPRVRARGRGRRDPGASRVRDVRGEEHPAARRHRLHLGARRPHHPEACGRAGRGVRARRRDRGRRRPPHRRRRRRRARGGAATRGRDLPRRGARVHRHVPGVARRPAARRVPRLRLRAGALAEALGPCRRARWSSS